MEYDRLIADRITSVPPSGIRKFFDILAEMPEVISLGIGEPDFVTPSCIMQAGIDSLQAGHTGYTSNSGLFELRKALGRYLTERYGVEYDPATEILVTVGVSEALHLSASALINPGEEVIIPEPCFVTYGPSIVFAGGTPVYVPTRVEEEFQVTGAVVERAVTEHTKALLIGYPSNPTGAVLTPARMQEVAEVAQRHNLIVFSDEIYDRLVYGIAHTCFASLPGMRERTILLGGFSKNFAMTGWRLGYACGPAPFIQALRKMHQYIIMSAPTPAQYAALAAIRQGDCHVAEMVEAYDRRRRLIVEGLNHIGLPTFEPRGAFYAFPSIESTGMTSEVFCERLLREEQVAVVPGSAFGPSGEGYVRCAYATSHADIEEALTRIERFVKRVG